MEKMIIFHRLTDENMRPALERWFRREHVPDVLVQTPWTVRYLLYRPVPPPPGAEGFGYYNYRIHESWAPDISKRRGNKGLLAMAPEPGDKAIEAQIIHIPADPTEDFLGQNLQFGALSQQPTRRNCCTGEEASYPQLDGKTPWSFTVA